MRNILNQISEELPNMTHSARKLGIYILGNFKEVSSMSISKLSELSGVSNATITRFSANLKLNGYYQLKSELQKIMYNYYTSADEITETIMKAKANDKRTSDVDDALLSVRQEYQNINKFLVKKAALLIYQSRRVLLVGNQISSLFVTYTDYLLSKYKKGLMNVSSLSFRNEQTIQSSGKTDCAIVFALQRYPQITFRAIKALNAANVPMIMISDSDLFPFKEMAEVMVCIPFKGALAFKPLIEVFSFIYDVILNVVTIDPETALTNVKEFDNYAEINNIYVKLTNKDY